MTGLLEDVERVIAGLDRDQKAMLARWLRVDLEADIAPGQLKLGKPFQSSAKRALEEGLLEFDPGALSNLSDVRGRIIKLGRPMKAGVLRTLLQDLDDEYPGIQRTPGVCGGDPRIRGTRIPVWLLEQYRRLGGSEANLLGDYSSLTSQDPVNAWAYLRSHPDEIDRQIRENEDDGSV